MSGSGSSSGSSKGGSASGSQAASGATSSKGMSSAAQSSQRSSKSNKAGMKDVASAKIGFLGAGKMTECIVAGLIGHASVPAGQIHVAAPSSKNLDKFKSMGCVVSKRGMDIFAKYACDVVFLAFHGSVIADCYKGTSDRPHALVVNYIPNLKKPIHILSLVSGWTMDQIKKTLLNPEHPHKYILEAHRIVINSSCAQGVGICAVDCDIESKRLSGLIRTLLSSIASLHHVPEPQQDAVCALTGSGLAFTYYFAQSLADGAFKVGLSRPMSVKIAAQTLQSAGQSALESGKNPNVLRDAVLAPKGAAIYGVQVLNKAEVASGITSAVEAAFNRSKELAQSGAK